MAIERIPDARAIPLTGREWVALVLLLLGTFALHADALRQPFFADDYFFLEQTRGISLPAALASPDPLGNFLRPISRQAYFWALSRVGHESPVVFHAANLALFLGCVLLVFLLVRRLGGAAAGWIAATFLALHYAADVPLRWVSGSQDLLAVLLAVATVRLHVAGRRAWAAVTLALALLSKESVALTAAVAIVAAHAPRSAWTESLRRGGALIAVTLGWVALWFITLQQRPATGRTLSFAPLDALATLVQLPRVALGLEFRQGGPALGHWNAVALGLGIAAAALFWFAARSRSGRSSGKVAPHSKDAAESLWRTGLAWTLVGTLPLLVVMPIWSAYYFLFALVGVSMLVAALTSRLPLGVRVALLGTLVALSAQARALDQFAAARGAWAPQSHVNRHYLARAQGTIARYLTQLKAARPTLPPRSTLFYGNLPVSLGWQAGDGPLLRWAYRDSSLRSYYLSEFSRAKAERGPMFLFAVKGDSLKDQSADPMVLPTLGYSLLVAERPQAAVEALDVAIAQRAATDSSAGANPLRPTVSDLIYWRAWARWDSGDSLGAAADLEREGFLPRHRLEETLRRRLADTSATANARFNALSAARKMAVLDPWIHGRLAALLLGSDATRVDGVIEAYAYRVLAPGQPDALRKWASAQLREKHHELALRTLERYLELIRATGHADPEAAKVAESLRSLVRGDRAQRSLQQF